MGNLSKLTKELLEEEYVRKGKIMKQIAKEQGVAVGTVFNYMKKFGIESRKTLTEEMKEKLRRANTGRPCCWRGKKMPRDVREKISLAKKGKYIVHTKYGGHTKKRKDGYIAVYCPNHKGCNKEGYVMEHILVMEEHIGRQLHDDEVVHHINHIREDNRIENLQLMTFKEHASLHMKERWQKKKAEKLAKEKLAN